MAGTGVLTAFWRAAPDGVTLSVKVHPKSRRPGLQGVVPGVDGLRLRIAVNEPAEDGRANRAVCVVLAEALDVPVAAVSILSGAASREKRVHVAGDPASLAVRLTDL